MFAIDLTPTVINRTAIFHIALDTSKALFPSIKKFRYGRTYVDRPITDRAKLDSLKEPILMEIFGKGRLIRERWLGPNGSTHRRPAEIERLFLFDPLYALFEDVTPEDVVLILDLTTVTDSEWHDPHVCELYRLAFRKVIAGGAKIASISQNTANALWANFGVPTNEVHVVPLYLRRAFEESSQAQKLEKGKILLFVGSLEARKNILGLIKGFGLSRLADEGFRLVIAGSDGVGAAAIKSLAPQVPGVELRGFVSDRELNDLYRTSQAFVYPSYLEGFGVPILEAAAAGLPILTSITGATEEVAPPGSILLDPYNLSAIADGLRSIASISEPALSLIAAENRIYAAKFSFDRYIASIKDLLNLNH